MTYTEAGGYSGELFAVYDNFGNMTDLRDNSGNSAKAVLVDPNNASITQYNPQGIDDPHSYRAREGFIGINDLWADNSGTVYLQGHIVIPNPWGDVVTNGTTTTTTDDKTEKSGGDEAEPCGKEWDPYKRCMWRCFNRCGPNDSCIGNVDEEYDSDKEDKERWHKWLETKIAAQKFIEGSILSFLGVCADIGFGRVSPFNLFTAVWTSRSLYLDFVLAMQIGEFLTKGKTIWESYDSYLEKEKKCRDHCKKYEPSS